MNKLLSVCIPTYNRAEHLDRQLSWLTREVQGFEHLCEVIVSDNCSDDSTPAVVAKWVEAYPNLSFTSNRNSENIGWMGNFLHCSSLAAGEYTWIIGDDDTIYNGALAHVIETLKNHPRLSLLYLNFSDRDAHTGATALEHWFDPSIEINKSWGGKERFQEYLQSNIGSVIFISATIFRTQLVLEAQQLWQDAIKNWAGLAFWNGYCAAKGEVVVTSENFLECTMGASYWQKDPKAWFKILHWDIPEVYVRLAQIGYPKEFCRRSILKILREDFSKKNLLSNLRYYLWCFAKAPLWSSRVVAGYFSCLSSLVI